MRASVRNLAERAYFCPVPGAGAAAPVREVLEGPDRLTRTASVRCESTAPFTRLSWSGWVVRWPGSWTPACGSSPSGIGKSRSAGSTGASTVLRSGSTPTGRSSCLASLERRWRPCWRIRSWRSRSGRAPSNGRSSPSPSSIGPGFTHGDAMAENVMVDLEAGVAHWFDFETIHDSRRPMAWRRADDVRALLVTCLVRTVPRSSPRPSSSSWMSTRTKQSPAFWPRASHRYCGARSPSTSPRRGCPFSVSGRSPGCCARASANSPPFRERCTIHLMPWSTAFMRIRPATIRKAATMRTNVNGSLRTATPTMKAPTAPMPVHTV